MCDTCGCNREEPFHVHTGYTDPERTEGHSSHFHIHRSEDGHAHVHGHSHPHDGIEGDSDPGATRTLAVNRGILGANDRLAEQNRGFFRAKNVRVINLLSSPGAGKTALLERTLEDVPDGIRSAVIVGDLATENDAERLRGRGAEAVQITTGTLCHLDARMVATAAEALDLEKVDLLFIENVGNLVCPASFDLGECLRVVLHSVPEGEDKPLKYPPVFKAADLVLLTKTDLAEASGFDRDRVLKNLARIAPQARVIELSSRTGEGMDQWYAYLAEPLEGSGRRQGAAAPQSL